VRNEGADRIRGGNCDHSSPSLCRMDSCGKPI
jgi:hypothetical protein